MLYSNTDIEKLSWDIANRLRMVANPQNTYELAYLSWRIIADRLDASNPFEAIHIAAGGDMDIEEVLRHTFKSDTDL